MKRTLIGLIAFLILMFPVRIYAEEWSELTGLLDDSLQLVKRNEDEKAIQVLKRFSEQFVLKGNEKSKPINPDQFRVISLAYDKAIQSLSEENVVGKQIKVDNMLALQLAVDAHVSKYQPLWMERERKIMDAFSQVEKAMKKEDDGQFQQTLNTFLNEFNIIYPSLMIALPDNEAQRVNAHLSYLDEFRNVMLKTKGGQMQLGIIKGDLQKIFHTVKKDEIAPSLIWFMTITGGLILLTLTYVGWRKYKGEREKRKSNLHSKNR
ncbi:sporulation protein YpjB [Bacillus paramycoides]|uniref:sporulation protein YpjB n=1 Tax=Bacillus paramycoides TaxID=2026194 RepID=UPI003D058B18